MNEVEGRAQQQERFLGGLETFTQPSGFQNPTVRCIPAKKIRRGCAEVVDHPIERLEREAKLIQKRITDFAAELQVTPPAGVDRSAWRWFRARRLGAHQPLRVAPLILPRRRKLLH